MERHAVEASQAVKDDLRGIYTYIDGVLCEHAAAVRIYGRLKGAIRSLEVLPKRQPLVDDPELAARGVRILRVENYIVAYVVHDVPPTVSVLRVLYCRREWQSLLEPRHEA